MKHEEIQITIKKISGYEFTGYVATIGHEYEGKKVYGEYDLDWNDNISIPVVTSVMVEDIDGVDITDMVDMAKLEDEIYENSDHAEWESERLAYKYEASYEE